MFEIGSEFWTEAREEGCGLRSIIPREESVIYTLSGRTALDIVIRDILAKRKAQFVYMPSYCCHTMIDPFLRNGIEVEFYEVLATDDGIRGVYTENKCDLVFIIDYFGFKNRETIEFAEKERSKGKTIIYDATHALFCSNNDYSKYDYIYGSFRKWTSINAGFAAKNEKWVIEPILRHNIEYERLRNDSFDMKATFIQNQKSIDKSWFLSSFQLAEEMLETDYQNYSPDARSTESMNSLDITRIRKARRKNAEHIIEGIKNCNNIILPYKTIKQEECPLFVPMMIRNERNTIRKHLIDHSIYLPIHWPISSLHRLTPESRMIYDEEMSCVCDQRYTEDDMEHIIKVMRQYD